MNRQVAAWALAGVLASGGALRADDGMKDLKAQLEALRKEVAGLRQDVQRSAKDAAAGATRDAAALVAELRKALAARKDAAGFEAARLLELSRSLQAEGLHHGMPAEALAWTAEARPGGAAKSETYLGVLTEPVGEALAAQLGLPAGQGLAITEVAADSPAGKAGLKKHGVIVSVDGKPVATPEALKALIVARKPGDQAELSVRVDGQTKDVTVALAARKLPSDDLDAQFFRVVINTPAGAAFKELDALAAKRPGDRELVAAVAAARQAVEAAADPQAAVNRFMAPQVRILFDQSSANVKPIVKKADGVGSMALTIVNGKVELRLEHKSAAGAGTEWKRTGTAAEVRAALEAEQSLPAELKQQALKALEGVSAGGKPKPAGGQTSAKALFVPLKATIDVKPGQ